MIIWCGCFGIQFGMHDFHLNFTFVYSRLSPMECAIPIVFNFKCSNIWRAFFKIFFLAQMKKSSRSFKKDCLEKTLQMNHFSKKIEYFRFKLESMFIDNVIFYFEKLEKRWRRSQVTCWWKTKKKMPTKNDAFISHLTENIANSRFFFCCWLQLFSWHKVETEILPNWFPECTNL